MALKMPPKKEDICYTPQKLARISYQVVQTIYRHLEEGQFPNAWKLGKNKRKWLIPHRDVVEYLGFDPEDKQIHVVRD